MKRAEAGGARWALNGLGCCQRSLCIFGDASYLAPYLGVISIPLRRSGYCPGCAASQCLALCLMPSSSSDFSMIQRR